jgi:chorismate mutase
MGTWCRGIRGATTAAENSREAILEATREMLQQVIAANGIEEDDVASAVFTTTSDLNAEFPAVAARELGWTNTALMCGHEMHVPGSLPACIRVLIHWNTSRRADEIVHVYLRGARSLRPERAMPDTVTEPPPALSDTR